jgi:uncharacterized protein involved in oxidation of intracellular sulfur
MKATLIISTSNPEVMWNALRLGNLMLNEGDDVTIFLHGPAVEYQRLASDKFPLATLAKTFALSEGALLA